MKKAFGFFRNNKKKIHSTLPHRQSISFELVLQDLRILKKGPSIELPLSEHVELHIQISEKEVFVPSSKAAAYPKRLIEVVTGEAMLVTKGKPSLPLHSEEKREMVGSFIHPQIWEQILCLLDQHLFVPAAKEWDAFFQGLSAEQEEEEIGWVKAFQERQEQKLRENQQKKALADQYLPLL